MKYIAKKTPLILLLISLMLSAFQCEKECDEVYCKNGGYCIGGFCECELGYSGRYCENRLTPVSMHIYSIEVLDYQRVNQQGDTWDAATGTESLPDLLLQVQLSPLQPNPPTVNGCFTPAAENLATMPYKYELPQACTIDQLDQVWDIVLYDQDTNNLEIVGHLNFTPLLVASDYPTNITLHSASSPYSIILHVNWTF
jgi:hypothetical protein